MSYENIAEVKEFFDLKKLDKSSGTLRIYNVAFDKFSEYFKIETFEDIVAITPSKIREYMGYLQSTGIKKSSINTYLRFVKALYNWLLENEYVEKSPMAKIKELKEDEVDRQFFSYDEVDAMMVACEDNIEDKVILTLLISTGIRRTELTRIKLEDYKGNHIVIRKETTKSKRQKICALSPEVCDLLDEYVEYRNKRFGDASEYLLVTKMRSYFSGEAIRLRLIGICKRAGFSEDRLKQVHVHMTRHTFGANFMEEVGDVKLLQSALGHAQMSTTEKIYAHITNSALDHAVLSMRSILPRKS